MLSDDAAVQAVAPMNIIIEVMPLIMALGGWLWQC
jgi:hypothetical protein